MHWVSNLARAATFCLYAAPLPRPLALSALAGATVLDKFAWVSLGSVIAGFPGSRRASFGLVAWARNAGIGIGAISGGALGVLGPDGLRCVVLVNAASFAAAAWLLGRADGGERGDDIRPQGFLSRRAIADAARSPGLLRLTLSKTCFAICATTISMYLGVYLLDTVRTSSWVVGAVFAVNSALVVLAQPMAVRVTSHIRAPRLIAAGGLAYVVATMGFAASALHWQGAAIAVLLFMALYTAGEIVIAPSSDGLAADLAPQGATAPSLSLYQASWSLASIASPAMGGILMSRSAPSLWLICALVAAAGSLSAGSVAGRLRHQESGRPSGGVRDRNVARLGKSPGHRVPPRAPL